jgi:hypothetical protein
MANGYTKIKHLGNWVEPKAVSVKQSGTWTPVKKVFTKYNGTWQQVWPSATAIFATNTDTLSFTVLEQAASIAQRITITNTGDYKLTITKVIISANNNYNISVDYTGFDNKTTTIIEPGKTQYIDVKIEGKLAGTTAGTIKFDATLDQNETPFTKTIAINGVVNPATVTCDVDKKVINLYWEAPSDTYKTITSVEREYNSRTVVSVEKITTTTGGKTISFINRTYLFSTAGVEIGFTDGSRQFVTRAEGIAGDTAIYNQIVLGTVKEGSVVGATTITKYKTVFRLPDGETITELLDKQLAVGYVEVIDSNIVVTFDNGNRTVFQPNEAVPTEYKVGYKVLTSSNKSTTAQSATFTVKNNGTGTLNISSITKPEWILVNPSSITIPAGTSRNFNVSLSGAVTTGTYTGTITIYNNSPIPAVGISVSAAVDPVAPPDPTPTGKFVYNQDATYTIPRGVTSLLVEAYGGGGGGGGYNGKSVNVIGEGDLKPVSLDGRWSTFMNNNAVWGLNTGLNASFSVSRTFTATYTGKHYFKFSADNSVKVTVDGTEIGSTNSYTAITRIEKNLTAGTHTIKITATDYGVAAGVALIVTNDTDTDTLFNLRNVLIATQQGNSGIALPGQNGAYTKTSIAVTQGDVFKFYVGTGGKGGLSASVTGGGEGGRNSLGTYKQSISSQTWNKTSSGSGQWRVPQGVTSVDVILVGAGAGGASGSEGDPFVTGGGGGGAGEAKKITLAVTPGEIINYEVGAGGIGGAGAKGGQVVNGAAGGDTKFGNNIAIGGRAPEQRVAPAHRESGGRPGGEGGTSGESGELIRSSSSTVDAVRTAGGAGGSTQYGTGGTGALKTGTGPSNGSNGTGNGAGGGGGGGRSGISPIQGDGGLGAPGAIYLTWSGIDLSASLGDYWGGNGSDPGQFGKSGAGGGGGAATVVTKNAEVAIVAGGGGGGGGSGLTDAKVSKNTLKASGTSGGIGQSRGVFDGGGNGGGGGGVLGGVGGDYVTSGDEGGVTGSRGSSLASGGTIFLQGGAGAGQGGGAGTSATIPGNNGQNGQVVITLNG